MLELNFAEFIIHLNRQKNYELQKYTHQLRKLLAIDLADFYRIFF